jgi:ABC-2 type transport system ATP-binding protein
VSAPRIEVRDVGFAYGKAPVLSGISLSVGEGEVYGVVGPDGAGKSTLLALAIGQLKAASGSIQVLGRDPADPALRDDIAYMPQGFGLYLDLSVQENLDFFADLHGMPRSTSVERIRDLLARTGLQGFEGRRAGHLSGGMMQKLALACALVSHPKAMFLDEPTTGVDPLSRRAFWALLDGVRADGVAILYATANMDEAERCDRVGVLEAGALTHQGRPAELVAGAAEALVSVRGAGVRSHREAIRRLPAVRRAFPEGPALKVWLVPGATPEAFARDLEATCPGCDVRPLAPGLHDVILRDLSLAREVPARAGA